jgi:hypothetical protein
MREALPREKIWPKARTFGERIRGAKLLCDSLAVPKTKQKKAESKCPM